MLKHALGDLRLVRFFQKFNSQRPFRIFGRIGSSDLGPRLDLGANNRVVVRPLDR
jgi:hypothetical protein